MIVVTRLNDSQFAINPDLIERIHANPDTTLVMIDGAKYIVTESLTEVIDRIARYRASVIALSHEISLTGQRPGARPLGLVEDVEDLDIETTVHAIPRKI
jgi:flagellar protein FlbD